MRQKFLILFFIGWVIPVFGQSEQLNVAPISDCEGAIQLTIPGSYASQFTGEQGLMTELLTDKADQKPISQNMIWLSYHAKSAGAFSFETTVPKGNLQLVIFKGLGASFCEKLNSGAIPNSAFFEGKEGETIRLNKTEGSTLPPISLQKDENILIALITSEKSKEIVKYTFDYLTNTPAKVEKQIVDTRIDGYSPMIQISVRNAVTKEPVLASIVVEGVKDVTAAYYGTDVLATVTRVGKAKIQCDAKGYFFVDKIEPLTNKDKQEIVVLMEPIGKGKSLQLEEIEFQPGTSDIQESSEIRLTRLRDFMAMNAEINIEIQGHVFAAGTNTVNSQRMSEDRAKSVMRYLIANGIAKDRMSAVGFGNTKPIYKEPKNDRQEQANRRVEIKVK
jgi:outer membrane protein OmpA-like peptidoglycan-associated protein